MKHAAISQFISPGNPTDPELKERIEKARAETAIKFNSEAANIVARLGKEDGKAGVRRGWYIFVLTLILTIGCLAIVGSVFFIDGPEKLAVTIPAAAVVIALLAVAGLVNPLQTVERDVVFRRWSDVIMAAFMLQAGSYDMRDNIGYRRAVKQASTDFAALAVAYGAATGKTVDALAAIIATGAKPEPEPGEALTLAVTSPGEQTGTVGKAIEPLRVEATGPGTLTWGVDSPPAGITINADTGELTGTPTTEGPVNTVVTVTSDEITDSYAVTFTWTVEAATQSASTSAAPDTTAVTVGAVAN